MDKLLRATRAKDVYICLVDPGKVYGRVSREKFCGCCGSPVLTGASCWPSSNCTPPQKIVSVSTEGSHNRSAVVLNSNNGVCGTFFNAGAQVHVEKKL